MPADPLDLFEQLPQQNQPPPQDPNDLFQIYPQTQQRAAVAALPSVPPGGRALPVRPGIYGEAALQTGKDVGQQLLRIPRILSDAAAAIPLAAADAGVTARNLLMGSNYQLPSSMYQQAWQATGLPQAETTIEKVGDFAASGVAGARLPLPSVARPAPVVTGIPRAPDAAAAVIREGEKQGVPVFFDDVTRNAFARRVGVAAETLPVVGTGGGRATQAAAAQKAAERVTRGLVPGAGDDVPALVQAGLKDRYEQFRTASTKLYDEASRLLDPPSNNVSTVQFNAAIQKELARQQALGTRANPAVVDLLNKYAGAPGGNFSSLRAMRSDLGDEISDFYTGRNATIGAKGVSQLQAMKSALERDMEAFAGTVGGTARDAWKRADGFYKANLVPFKEAGFRDLIKTAEPEKAWRYLVSQGGVPSRAIRMYRSLTEDGRSAVRYGLVKDAMDNSMTPQGTFSPARFAKYLEDHEPVVNTFFKGRDLAEIKGFQNLMRHVERAGQFAENPPTGQRVIPWLLGGAAVVEPTTAAVVATTGLGVKTLFQTVRGRNLLLAMGRTSPGSSAATRITQEIAKVGAATGAVAATQSGIAEENE